MLANIICLHGNNTVITFLNESTKVQIFGTCTLIINTYCLDKFHESSLHIEDIDLYYCFEITVDCVQEAFSHMKSKKVDGSVLDFNHSLRLCK